MCTRGQARAARQQRSREATRRASRRSISRTSLTPATAAPSTASPRARTIIVPPLLAPRTIGIVSPRDLDSNMSDLPRREEEEGIIGRTPPEVCPTRRTVVLLPRASKFVPSPSAGRASPARISPARANHGSTSRSTSSRTWSASHGVGGRGGRTPWWVVSSSCSSSSTSSSLTLGSIPIGEGRLV
jgi:hypothetical protein